MRVKFTLQAPMRIPKFPLRKSCCAPCLLALALLGCNRATNQEGMLGTLDGSVFVVTEARDNIKMGLVKVQLFDEASANAIVKTGKPTVESALTALRSKLPQAGEDSAKSVKLIAEAESQAAEGKERREGAEKMLELIESGIESDKQFKRKAADVGLTLIPSQEDIATKRKLTEAAFAVAKQGFTEGSALTNSAAKLRSEAIDLAAQAKAVRDEVARWPDTSAALYLSRLPRPAYEAKTDADGKFSLQLPAKARFAVIAQAERATPAGREQYNWFLWVSLNGAKSKSIMLSNDNLWRANDADSVVKLESP